MTIGKLLVALFATGRKLDPELSKQWTLASHKIGSQIPRSLMVVSVQRLGEIDLAEIAAMN